MFPEVTVIILILDKSGKVLLIKSPKWGHRYVFPGGHVELGETAAAAVKREALEETGLKVKNIDFVTFRESIFDPLYSRHRHLIGLVFTCQTTGGHVKLNSEGEEYKWAALSEAQIQKILTL